MQKKVLNLAVPVLILGLILSACTLPASTPPPPTPTPTSLFPFPVATEPDILSAIMTQTAQVEDRAKSETETEEVEEPEIEPTRVPIPTLTRPASYTLKKGEHPFCIARRFNLDVGQFLAVNGLNIDSKPSVGTTLQIPGSGNWNTGPISLKSHPTTYTVRTGDTIYLIACQYGDVSPEAIIAANGLQEPYSLTAGQTLQIP